MIARSFTAAIFVPLCLFAQTRPETQQVRSEIKQVLDIGLCISFEGGLTGLDPWKRELAGEIAKTAEWEAHRHLQFRPELCTPGQPNVRVTVTATERFPSGAYTVRWNAPERAPARCTAWISFRKAPLSQTGSQVTAEIRAKIVDNVSLRRATLDNDCSEPATGTNRRTAYLFWGKSVIEAIYHETPLGVGLQVGPDGSPVAVVKPVRDRGGDTTDWRIFAVELAGNVEVLGAPLPARRSFSGSDCKPNTERPGTGIMTFLPKMRTCRIFLFGRWIQWLCDTGDPARFRVFYDPSYEGDGRQSSCAYDPAEQETK